MDKKAEFNLTKEYLIWVVRGILFAVIFSSVIILIYIGINSTTDINGLKHSLIRQHLLYDKNCLAYENDKVYPGIIDLNKFNKNNLEKCLVTKEQGIRITLKNNLIMLNDKLADKFEFCFDKKNFYCSNTTFYVLIHENDTLTQGALNIAILNQK